MEAIRTTTTSAFGKQEILMENVSRDNQLAFLTKTVQLGDVNGREINVTGSVVSNTSMPNTAFFHKWLFMTMDIGFNYIGCNFKLSDFIQTSIETSVAFE